MSGMKSLDISVLQYTESGVVCVHVTLPALDYIASFCSVCE